MPTDEELGFPHRTGDERESLLGWLGYLRGAVLRDLEGLGEADAHWTPNGALISVIGIVQHLTGVERRWIEFRMPGREVERDEGELTPGPDLTASDAVAAYRAQAVITDAAVRATSLDESCRAREDTDLRWVLLHLINETARHAGHADATRELLDGRTGE